MRLGVPFVAPRQLGAVESIPGIFAFMLRNFCLLSPGAPNSPVHHRTLSGADLLPYMAKPTVAVLEPLAHRTLSGAHLTLSGAHLTLSGAHLTLHPIVGTYHVSRADPAADRWLG
jgi:hypothetical protein